MLFVSGQHSMYIMLFVLISEVVLYKSIGGFLAGRTARRKKTERRMTKHAVFVRLPLSV